MDIQGAVAFVTGASGGLGACIAKALARSGVNVALGYRRGADRAAELCREIEAQGGAALTVPIEQSEPASIEAAISQVTSQFGGLDLLINNAGMATGGHDIAPGDLAAFTPEIWDELMAVNMRGPYLLARAAAPHLRASLWGRIVNIGSMIAMRAAAFVAAYSASKAGLLGLTRSVALDLAERGLPIRANMVHPGAIRTPMYDRYKYSGVDTPENIETNFAATHPMNRIGEPEEVAKAVVFLASDEASFTTGCDFTVDGGGSIRS